MVTIFHQYLKHSKFLVSDMSKTGWVLMIAKDSCVNSVEIVPI